MNKISRRNIKENDFKNENKHKNNYYENEMGNNEKIINEIDLMFNKFDKFFKDLEHEYSNFKENINRKINFMNENMKKNIESNINYQMKSNFDNNNLDLSKILQKIKNTLDNQTKEINGLISY